MRNSSLVERFGVDNNRALNTLPKLWNPFWVGRGAFHRRRRCIVRYVGDYGKANVGISNDKEGEKPSRRKTKDS